MSTQYRCALLALFVAAILGLAAACSAASTPDEPLAFTDEPSTVLSLGLMDRGNGPPGLEVITPVDGSEVFSPFVVEIEPVNFSLAPVGRIRDGEGHWHILVDRDCETPGVAIEKNEVSIHVGNGRDHTVMYLEAGEHKLCVQLGDGFHVAVDVSDSIHLTVVE